MFEDNHSVLKQAGMLLKEASAIMPYGKFCVKRLWDQASEHNKWYIIWSRITCRLQLSNLKYN